MSYDPDTGLFTWIKRPHSRPESYVGARAGGPDTCGYWRITFLGVRYGCNHLAWYFTYREWLPKGVELDHRNRMRNDNRIANLRIATRAGNVANGIRKRKEGYKGVYPRETGKWRAMITVRGRVIRLGQFIDPVEAARAYDAAAVAHFGEFARLNFEPLA